MMIPKNYHDDAGKQVSHAVACEEVERRYSTTMTPPSNSAHATSCKRGRAKIHTASSYTASTLPSDAAERGLTRRRHSTAEKTYAAKSVR